MLRGRMYTVSEAGLETKMDKPNRRSFLAASAGAVVASAAGAGKEWRNRQPGMAYRRLGRTGFMVSEIVMGGNSIRPDNHEHVLAAMDMGLNYFDTASSYGRGGSERGYARVARARPRDSFFINTKISLWDGNRNKLYSEFFKSLSESEQAELNRMAQEAIERRRAGEPDYMVGYFYNQDRPLKAAALSNAIAKKYGDVVERRIDHRKLIIDSVEGSLRRLGTDYVDVVTCPHGACTPEEVLNCPGIFEAFEILKKQGKARHLGVSAHTDSAGILEAAVETGVYSMAMVAYNIVNHRYVDQALETAKKNDLGVIAMKVARAVHLDRRKGPFDDPARVKLIQDAVGGPFKVPQKAYLWVLRNPNVSAVISEMTNMDLVKDNVPLAGQKGT